jgi:hypothetical protein
MAVQATRRMVLLLVTTLVVVAMMTVAVMAVSPAFAEPKGGQTPENSCGASNPNIEHPPNRENKEASGEFVDCGFRNNPNFVEEE